MAEVKDLEFMSKQELLIHLAGEIQKIQTRIEVLDLVLGLVDQSPEQFRDDGDKSQSVLRAREAKPRMEKDALVLRSMMHWLTKERS